MSFSEFDWVDDLNRLAIRYAQEEGLIPRDDTSLSRGLLQQLPAWEVLDKEREVVHNFVRKPLPGWDYPLSEDEE